MKEDKLFLVMKKIFLGHYKEMRILILCEMILTAISYAIVSGYQMFSSGHSSEYFLQEDGISKSFFCWNDITLLWNGINYYGSDIISGETYSGICVFTKNGDIQKRFKKDGFI